MSAPATILIVEDDAQIRRLLELTLEPEGFRCRTAETAREGIAMAGTERPEAVLLDLGLPDLDGKEALAEIKTRTHAPVLIISVRASEAEIIECLNGGADDYVVKPFRTGELIARLRAALRRTSAPGGAEIVTVGELTLNYASRTLTKRGTVIHLTATEFALLTLFVKNSGRVLTHQFLLEHVWGPDFLGETQYTRVYVGHLRQKIEDDRTSPRYILTESGIGYRFGPG